MKLAGLVRDDTSTDNKSRLKLKANSPTGLSSYSLLHEVDACSLVFRVIYYQLAKSAAKIITISITHLYTAQMSVVPFCDD